MSDDQGLQPGELELTNTQELLWRNVHPIWIDDGQLTSQAFRPTPKDDKRLSTARQQKIAPDEHFREYTEVLSLTSSGVWAISVGEAHQESLRCIYDAESNAVPDPCPTGHTSVDFSDHGNGRIRRIGSALRDAAEARGQQHP